MLTTVQMRKFNTSLFFCPLIFLLSSWNRDFIHVKRIFIWNLNISISFRFVFCLFVCLFGWVLFSFSLFAWIVHVSGVPLLKTTKRCVYALWALFQFVYTLNQRFFLWILFSLLLSYLQQYIFAPTLTQSHTQKHSNECTHSSRKNDQIFYTIQLKFNWNIFACRCIYTPWNQFTWVIT